MQMPADARGRGDRMQLAGLFYENLQTISESRKEKTLGVANNVSGKKSKPE